MKAIKVNKCIHCRFCQEFSDGDFCMKISQHGGKIRVDGDKIHPSCPLPDWPEVGKEKLEEWKLHNSDSSELMMSIDELRAIGVIVKEEKDGK